MNVPVIIYFVVLCTIGSYLFYHTKGSTLIKMLLMLMMFYAGTAVYFSFDSYKGWPSKHDPSKDLLLIGVVIYEKTRTTDGAIYALGIPCTSTYEECFSVKADSSIMAALSPYGAFGFVPTNVYSPRLYEFPYTDANRQEFAEARRNIERGGRSTIRANSLRTTKSQSEGTGMGREGENEAGEGGGGDSTYNQKGSRSDDSVEIVDIAPEAMMDKNETE